MTTEQKQLGQYTGRARFVMGSREAADHAIQHYAPKAQRNVKQEIGRPTLITSNWVCQTVEAGHVLVEFDFDYVAHCEGDIHYNLRRFLRVACEHRSGGLEPYQPVRATEIISETLCWEPWT
jgi:hypothetical protein